MKYMKQRTKWLCDWPDRQSDNGTLDNNDPKYSIKTDQCAKINQDHH